MYKKVLLVFQNDRERLEEALRLQRVGYSLLLGYVQGFPRSPSFFFFQAEDGIRDLYVTGVQTRALPISTGRSVSLGVEYRPEMRSSSDRRTVAEAPIPRPQSNPAPAPIARPAAMRIMLARRCPVNSPVPNIRAAAANSLEGGGNRRGFRIPNCAKTCHVASRRSGSHNRMPARCHRLRVPVTACRLCVSHASPERTGCRSGWR